MGEGRIRFAPGAQHEVRPEEAVGDEPWNGDQPSPFQWMMGDGTGTSRPRSNGLTASVRRQRAYTLIEILVVCAIIGIVCTMTVPMLYHKLNPDSMKKASEDIVEACTQARAGAILNGTPIDMVIRVEEDQSMHVSLQAGAGRSTASEGDVDSPSVSGEEWRMGQRSAGGSAPSFTARISDKIAVELIEVNFQDAMEWAEVRVRFYPNGTSDEFKMLMFRPDTNERRLITLEVVTALVDVESDLLKMKPGKP